MASRIEQGVVWRPVLIGLMMAGNLLADGGIFVSEGVSPAQTRQEALLAVQPDKVTYVVRMVYTGDPEELAWVLPMPGTPTNVVAHEHDWLFEALNILTRPTFESYSQRGLGCACTGPMFDRVGSLVQVEAQGQAGIYDWAALTSTGSDALLAWLTDHGFEVPAEAAPILDSYVEQDMHFLAIKVRDASDLEAEGTRGVPPIQFDVATTEWFYPMVISRISAATETEVLIYFLAPNRVQAANVPNGLIDPAPLHVDFDAESHTNYEQLFRDEIARLGDLALITEHAASFTEQYIALNWPQAPAGLFDDPLILTRMRTLAGPANMTKDLRFEQGPDVEVHSLFGIDRTGGQVLASTFGQPAVVVAALGAFVFVSRRLRRA